MATKKSTPAELLRFANATRIRLEKIVEALNAKRMLSPKQERAVHAMYAAAHPKGPAWVDFVDALQFVAADAPLQKAAAFVIEECADSFPELANLKPAFVEAAITAWRKNKSKWQKTRAALVDAIPAFKVKEATMQKQWPRLRPRAEE